jgi:hypothetical protein
MYNFLGDELLHAAWATIAREAIVDTFLTLILTLTLTLTLTDIDRR